MAARIEGSKERTDNGVQDGQELAYLEKTAEDKRRFDTAKTEDSQGITSTEKNKKELQKNIKIRLGYVIPTVEKVSHDEIPKTSIESNELLSQSIETFLKHPKQRVLLIQGPSGIGKSSSLAYIETYAKSEGFLSTTIPLNLYTESQVSNADNPLIPRRLKESGWEPKSQQPKLLLLDAQEELQERKGLVNIHRRNQLETWTNLKVIITCRQEALTPPYVYFFKPDNCEDSFVEWQIQPLQGESQRDYVSQLLKSYQEKHGGCPISSEEYLKAIENLPPELAGIPQILNFCLKGIISFKLQGKEANFYNRYQIYEAAIDAHFNREQEEKRALDVVEAGDPLGRCQRFYAEEMAIRMWIQGGKSLASSGKNAWDLKFFPEACKYLPTSEKGRPREFLLKQTQSCLLSAQGVGENQVYRFQHASIQEYLVTSWLLTTLNEKISFELLQTRPAKYGIQSDILVSDMAILQFLRERLLDDEANGQSFKKRLRDIVISTREDKSLGELAALAMTLLNGIWGRFQYEDYSQIRIPGAILRDGVFYETNFEGSDLINVDMSNTDITLANFRSCDMAGVKFGRYPSYKIPESRSGNSFHNCISDNLEEVLNGYDDGSIEIFSIKDNKPILRYRPDNTKVTDLVWKYDEKIIISVHSNGRAYLKEQTSEKEVPILNVENTGISKVAISQSSKVLAVCYNDGYILLWDYSNQSPQITRGIKCLSKKILTLNFCPGTNRLVVGYADCIQIYNLKTDLSREMPITLKANGRCVAVGQDGRTFVSPGFKQHEISCLWNSETGTLIQEFYGDFEDFQCSLYYDSTNKFILASDTQGNICGWTLGIRNPIFRIPPERGMGITQIKINHKKNRVVVMDYDGTIRFYDFVCKSNIHDINPVRHHRDLGMSYDGKRLFVDWGTLARSKISVYDYKPSKNHWFMVRCYWAPIHVKYCTISRDGSILVTIGRNNGYEGNVLCFIKGGLSRIFTLPFSSSLNMRIIGISEDNEYIVYYDGVSSVGVVNINEEKIVWSYQIRFEPNMYFSSTISRDFFAIVDPLSQKSELIIFNLATGKIVKSYQYDGHIGKVAISQIGSRVAVGCGDGCIYLSNFELEEESPRVLPASYGAVNDLTFNHDANGLFVAYYSGVIVNWDITSGLLTSVITHSDYSYSIFLTENSERLELMSESVGGLRRWEQPKVGANKNKWFLAAESGHRGLFATKANLDGVKNISHQSLLLLSQLGAVPAYPLLYPKSYPLLAQQKVDANDPFLIRDWSLELTESPTYSIKKSRDFPAVKIILKREHRARPEDEIIVLKEALQDSFNRVRDLNYIDLSENQLDDDAMFLLSFAVNGEAPYKNIRMSQCRALVLSHNQIGYDGLKVLLRALATRPSITQILLDNNRIDLSLYFLNKVIKPLSEAAKIINLDLSLNFIPKGRLAEEPINGKMVRVYSEDKSKSELEAIETFFKDFATLRSTRCESGCERMFVVSSLIASVGNVDKKRREESININIGWGVIGLFANRDTNIITLENEHAYLVLEGMSTFGQRYLIRGDLYSTPNGKVLTVISQCSPEDFLKFTGRGEKIHCQLGKFTQEELEKVLKAMSDSRRMEDFHSYRVLPGNNAAGTYNCLTWAIEMLKGAGVKKDLNSWLPSKELRPNARCIIS